MDELLDYRLDIFSLVVKIKDPERRDKAYGAVRDATDKKELAKYAKYLQELTDGPLVQTDQPANALEAFRDELLLEAKDIHNSTKRDDVASYVTTATDLETLEKYGNRIEVILLEQSATKTGTDLVKEVFSDEEVQAAQRRADG
jgi:hypothetical protein